MGPNIPEAFHLLGDGAYPLRRWLLTPHRDTGHLLPEEKRYNTRFSGKRQVIERAFGMLKGRFPRLKFCNIQQIKYAVNIVSAACVLHNMSLADDLPADAVVEPPEPMEDGDVGDNDEGRAAGVIKRNDITALFR